MNKLPITFYLNNSKVEAKENERNIKLRSSILNVYFLPEINNNLLYNSITPVNTFRVIFNHYFDAGYDLLKDQVHLQ